MHMPSKRQRRGLLRTTAVALWIAIVGVVTLWQSINYSGVVAVLGEWQFDTIGIYYPTLTAVLVIGILSSPMFLLLMNPLRIGRGRPEAILLRSARSFYRALLAIVGGLALLAVAMLVAMLSLPADTGPTQSIVLDRPLVALPREGPTTINGDVVYARIAALDTDQLFAKRTARYAPVVAPGAQDNNLQFFVELRPVDNITRRGSTSVTGILRRGALPGEIVQLYRYAGYRVEQPFYVLYSDLAALRRPYFVVAGQLAFAALLAAIVALLQGRRLRAIRRRIDTGRSGLSAA